MGLLMAGLLVGQASAAMYGLPPAFRKQITQVSVEQAVVPPLADSRFCEHYADTCRVPGFSLHQPKPVVLTPDRMHERADMNRCIVPTAFVTANFHGPWSISRNDDCNVFAVTKRHDFLARGWPSLIGYHVWGSNHVFTVYDIRLVKNV